MVYLITSMKDIHDNNSIMLINRFIRTIKGYLDDNKDDNEIISKVFNSHNLAMRFCIANQSDNIIYCEGNPQEGKIKNKSDFSEYSWVVVNGVSIDLRAIIGGLFIDTDITNTNRYSLNLSAITNGRDFSNYKSLVSLRRLDSTLPIGGVTSLVK